MTARVRQFIRFGGSPPGRWHLVDGEYEWGWVALCQRFLERDATRGIEITAAPEQEPAGNICRTCAKARKPLEAAIRAYVAPKESSDARVRG
jgi:hypothetical protein